MRSTIKKPWAGAALAALTAVFLIGSPSGAQALPITWHLQNVGFNDTTAVTGEFTINVYGFFEHNPPVDLTTVNGALAGFHYTDSTPNFIYPSKLLVEFSHGDYHGYLSLEFQFPLTTDNLAFDPIVIGPYSYECSGYENYGANGGFCPANATSRSIISGGAANLDVAAVPEPGTLVLIGSGLLALGALRRRAKKPAR